MIIDIEKLAKKWCSSSLRKHYSFSLGQLEKLIEAYHAEQQRQEQEPVKRSIAWLVEKREEGKPLKYRTMINGWIEWTENVQEAIRFARREDADMFSNEDIEHVHIAEHMWIGE